MEGHIKCNMQLFWLIVLRLLMLLLSANCSFYKSQNWRQFLCPISSEIFCAICFRKITFNYNDIYDLLNLCLYTPFDIWKYLDNLKLFGFVAVKRYLPRSDGLLEQILTGLHPLSLIFCKSLMVAFCIQPHGSDKLTTNANREISPNVLSISRDETIL